MEARAVVKNTGVSPRKVGLLVAMIRGKKVEEALALLKFAPTPNAMLVVNAIKSAVANAENNMQLSATDLTVVRASVDTARTLKRFRARSRGRVSHILKRSSHITIVVAEES